jgi:hypothetical protein
VTASMPRSVARFVALFFGGLYAGFLVCVLFIEMAPGLAMGGILVAEGVRLLRPGRREPDPGPRRPSPSRPARTRRTDLLGNRAIRDQDLAVADSHKALVA